MAGVEDGTTDEAPVDDLVVVGRLVGAFDVVADAVVVDLVEDVVGVLGEVAELPQEEASAGLWAPCAAGPACRGAPP